MVKNDRQILVWLVVDLISAEVMIPYIAPDDEDTFEYMTVQHISNVLLKNLAYLVNDNDVTYDEILEVIVNFDDEDKESGLYEILLVGSKMIYDAIVKRKY